METMQWKAMLQHEFSFNNDMSICVSKQHNKVFLMGGSSKDFFYPANDVYSWDIINDRVARRNHMPRHSKSIKLAANRDKIYCVGRFIYQL